MSQPESTETVVHVCPLGDDALTTCCGKTVFELPRSDRITAVPGMATCRPNVPDLDLARVARFAEAIRSRPWGGVPAGFGADDIGAPELPRLCDDHRPVIRSLSKKDHVGDEDSARTAIHYARQCLKCIALNPRSTR